MTATHALGIGIELSQFHRIFFEEAGENLDRMEAQLLALHNESADDEQLNSIFRCAHSLKGGAATFGFADVAELTHRMETLLDRLRRHELMPTAAMVDLLLQSGDALKAQLACHQSTGGDAVDTRELLLRIQAVRAGPAPAAARRRAPTASVAVRPVPRDALPPESLAAAPSAAAARTLDVRVGPLKDPSQADDLVELFNEITDLGTIQAIDGGRSIDGVRRFRVVTTSSDADLLDLFGFHVARADVQLLPVGIGCGLFAPVRADKAPAAALGSSTLRVSVEKVDQLVDLVGELVVTQAMLAQHSQRIDPALGQPLAAGLAALERHTRDLQAAVMSIRMMPMATVFGRFPRMLHDLAARLGKKVELVTQGEATELDKGLVEQIIDPLTHLVRNSCDHGIESPAERLARAKPEQGTITLAASHQGSSILIEVRDDGRGLSRARLIAKARERGIAAPDSMTDAAVWSLIFTPGFSTAEVVTDVSGRGVGMDVVKQNITALGGTVEIDSAEGYSMSVKVRLPLTLTTMHGMSRRSAAVPA